jgi:hypothetical protein
VVPVVIGFAERLPRFYFLSIGKIIRQKRMGFEWRGAFVQCRNPFAATEKLGNSFQNRGLRDDLREPHGRINRRFPAVQHKIDG